MSESTYWYLKVPNGIWGYLLVSEGNYWGLSVRASICEWLLISEVA